jgi:hypothetical protein
MTLIKYILGPLNKFLALEFLWLMVKYLAQRKNQSNYPKFHFIFRRIIELIVNKLKIVRKDNSFAGETQAIQNILSRIGDHCYYLVDIGASDGITQSSTVKFLVDYNYSGLLFESEPNNFSKLAFLYNDRMDITLTKAKITPNNIVDFMVAHAVPQNFSLLNLDIDSYDLEVLRSLLVGGFKPKVISMEINEIFPPNIEFEVGYSDEHSWQGGHFFGCSVASADKTLRSLGYSLVAIEYNNAFFVDDPVVGKFNLKRNIFELYDQGYRNKIDRKTKFSGNSDVEFLLTAGPKECEEKIRALFLKHEGKFSLNIH